MNGCDQTYVPEDDAGGGSVVEVGGGEGAGATAAGGGDGRRLRLRSATRSSGGRRLAEEIGDAPHNVHRLRPEPTSASPPATRKPTGFRSDPKCDLDFGEEECDRER